MSAGAGEKEELRRLRRLVADLEAEREIARRLAAFQGGPAGRERIYRFISSESANFSVARLCQVCGVARSAYYDWLGRDRGGPSAALVEEAYLANRIFDIWRRARGRYGAPRVTAGLAKQGVEVNEKRVARLMGEMGIAGRAGRRKVRTTWRDKRQQAAVDLVLRHFTAAGPDQTWVGDITYVPTGEGWLFVASVLDVCSRMMVGWSIADHLRTELCADALEAAVATRGEVRMTGTVFHSDYAEDRVKPRNRGVGVCRRGSLTGSSA